MKAMLLHIAPVSGTPKSAVRCEELLALYALSSKRHTLTDDPEAAELIVLAGDLESRAEAEANELARHYPEKTFAYSEIDALVPYLPGVYGSAGKPRGVDLRRTQNNIYGSRYGSSMNPEVRHRPDEPKELLFFFRGRRDCAVRSNILSCPYNRDDVEVRETAGFMHWKDGLVGRREAQREYADLLAHSHFALCPRGMGFGSIRLFEVMEMGVAPVLLADHYALPPGPAWSRFLLHVPEREYARLPQILEAHRKESRERGRLARLAWTQFFAPELVFDRIVAQLEEIRRQRRLPERLYRRLWPLLALPVEARKWLRRS